MIDVLLTILVFFMTITSAQVLKVDKTINLPIAKDAQKKDNSRAEALVNVRWKDKRASFVFDDRVFPQAAAMVEPLKVAKVTGEKKVTGSANPSSSSTDPAPAAPSASPQRCAPSPTATRCSSATPRKPW